MTPILRYTTFYHLILIKSIIYSLQNKLPADITSAGSRVLILLLKLAENSLKQASLPFASHLPLGQVRLHNHLTRQATHMFHQTCPSSVKKHLDNNLRQSIRIWQLAVLQSCRMSSRFQKAKMVFQITFFVKICRF